MKVILKEEILRLNCPGFGEQSYLTNGKAKSLDSYKVIFVNPLSILHLFDRDADTLKGVDAALSDGLTTYNLPNDDLVNSLNDDITARTEELVRFLETGGLLVYFLCRPFILQGSSFALDNYVWLLSLAPVKSGDKNARQMSTAHTGRNIEPCEEASASEFADYFRQEGLEWNTVIRAEFLTEGYTPLATAGLKKCIAGELYAGDNGGRIVFLPAPYSPDFDRSLIQCTNIWYQKQQGLTPDRKEIAEAVANLLSPPRPEQKPALLKPSSQSLDNAPALGAAKVNPNQTSGNGAMKAPSQAPTPAKPPAQAAAAASASKPTVSAASLPRVATQSATNHPAVPPGAQAGAAKATTANAANATARPTAAPLVRGEAPPAAGKSPTTVGGAAGKPSPQVERKSPQTIEQQAPDLPTKDDFNANDLTTTADHARPDLSQEGQTEEAVSHIDTQDVDTQTDIDPAVEVPPQEAEVAEAPEAAELALDSESAKQAQQDKIATTSQSKAESLVRELEQAAATPASQQAARVAETSITSVKVDLSQKKPEVQGAGGQEWYAQYSISALEELRRERGGLIEQLKQMQGRMLTIENRVTTLTHMKNTLLGGGPELLDCCIKALGTLGWKAKPSPSEKDEICLSANDKPEALARIIRTQAQPTRSDLAQLAESIITFWGDNEVEPKGIMIACAWADTPLAERTETAFPDALVDFAKKKNICLLTTLQLLCAFRDIEFGKAKDEDIRKSILGTSGALDGLKLDTIKVNRS